MKKIHKYAIGILAVIAIAGAGTGYYFWNENKTLKLTGGKTGKT